VLSALLAACEGLPGPRGEPPASRPSVEELPAMPMEWEDDAQVQPEPETSPPQARPLPPAPAPRPEFAGVDPERLRGLTPNDAELLLGPPDLRSEEPPAVVWTYIVGPCRLELFFYYDLESQQQRSLTFDLAPGHKGESAEAFCFTLLGRRGMEARRTETVEEQLPGDGEGDEAEDTATQADSEGEQEEDENGE
jgi:hypothetical protein